MKAIRVHAPGGPEALRYEEVDRPAPGRGQVLVKIEAAGVNFIDVYQRTGHYKLPVPFTLGQEAAGTVTAVGPGVAEPNVGERVAYTSILGAYAEYAVVPADRVVALPDGVSAKQGAAAMLQGLTAHYLATTTYPLKPGDTCLVHAAAGGVDQASVSGLQRIGRGREVVCRQSLEHRRGALLGAHTIRERHDTVGRYDRVLRVRPEDAGVRDPVPDSGLADTRANGGHGGRRLLSPW